MTFARDLANFADISANNLTFRNSIINGAMQVSQRATSFTSTGSANNDDVYTLDRWTLLSDGNDAVDVTQATDAPTGLKYSCGLDVETANKKFGIIQFIENKNIEHLTGKTVTLSFYAKTTGSSISDVKAVVLAWTGTADTVTSDVVSSWNASGTVPTFAASWTAENTATNLSVTSSWARYSVSAVLDTSSTNNVAVFIWCDDATTTIGDFLYVSGVQLEVGSSASAYESKPIDVELDQCKRYYRKSFPYGTTPASSYTTTKMEIQGARHQVSDSLGFRSQVLFFDTEMRGDPTVTLFNGATDSSTTVRLYSNSGTTQDIGLSVYNPNSYSFYLARYDGVTIGSTGLSMQAIFNYTASAEL